MNILTDIHTRFTRLPIAFRERICEECNWSIPTFYRKMRLYEESESGQSSSIFSNAEREKIIEVLAELLQDVNGHFRDYTRKPGKAARERGHSGTADIDPGPTDRSPT